MSEENVEIARRAVEAFNEGGLAALGGFFDPDVTWHTDPRVPEPGEYEGKDKVLLYLDGYVQAFGTFRSEGHKFRDLGGDDVLMVFTVKGQPVGGTTGAAQFFEWCLIGTFRGGKVTSLRSYLDRAEALKAAGLSE